jgi:hypothetical protein
VRAGLEKRTGGCFGAVVVDKHGKIVGESYNHVIAENVSGAGTRQQLWVPPRFQVQVVGICALSVGCSLT